MQKRDPMKLWILKVLKRKNEIYQRIELKIQIKNGVICLVIMVTPVFMVIKMSQMAHYLYFEVCISFSNFKTFPLLGTFSHQKNETTVAISEKSVG